MMKKHLYKKLSKRQMESFNRFFWLMKSECNKQFLKFNFFPENDSGNWFIKNEKTVDQVIKNFVVSEQFYLSQKFLYQNTKWFNEIDNSVKSQQFFSPRNQKTEEILLIPKRKIEELISDFKEVSYDKDFFKAIDDCTKGEMHVLKSIKEKNLNNKENEELEKE